MLSGIASYLFGEDDPSVDVTFDTDDLNLRTTLAENEWVFVDKSSRANSPMRLRLAGDDCMQSADLPLWSARVNVCRPRRRGRSPSSSGGSPSPPESLCYPSLQESWVVTPPPCFIAGTASPVNVSIGSMENLLIEHPSMSVYVPPQSAASRMVTHHTHHPPSRPHAIDNRAGLVAAASARRRADVGMCRKQLERSNKTLQRAMTGKRQRRRKTYVLRSATATQRRY